MEILFQDIRFGLRMMRKHAGVTTAAIAALALGIGANTAIFSVVHAVLLRSLPYPNPERVMRLWVNNPRQGIDKDVTSFPNYADWRKQSSLFQEIGAYTGSTYTLTGSGEPEQLRGALVTPGFFPVLGVEARIGRTFEPDADRPGHENVVVLSHGLWLRRFGGDPDLVGRSLTLSGVAHTVVGIMPAGFAVPAAAELWTPLAPVGPLAQQMEARGNLWLNVLGRLQPEANRTQAQAEMDTIARRLEQSFPDVNAGMGIALEPLREELVGGIRKPLLILQGAVTFVLMIACANVANLLLGRAAARRREIAIRTVLGAGRVRTVRQLLTEGILLGLAGGAAGLAVAVVAVRSLLLLAPAPVRQMADTPVDSATLAFTLAVSVVTGLLFALVPALQVSAVDPGESLKETARTQLDGTRGQRLRDVLVVGQVALSLVLVAGGSLMARSFFRLIDVHAGFDAEHVLTLRIELPRLRYPRADQVRSFYDRLLERLAALPGAQSAGASTSILLSRLPGSANLSVEGRPAPARADHVEVPVTYDAVTAGFFRTLGIPLRYGRMFSARDLPGATPVAIANEALVRRFFRREDPLGKRVTFDDDPSGPKTAWYTLVGVVADARRSGLDVEPRAELYVPHSQSPDRAVAVVLRTAGDPAAYARAARAAVWEIDPDQPVSNVRPLRDLVAETLAARRFNALLLALSAGIALILAAVGIYAVTSYGVARRTQELGIRLALGAAPTRLLAGILGRGMGLAAAGVGIGLAVAGGLTRLLESLLFGISATDAATFAATAGLLGLVSLVATWLPARRVMRIDPMMALRYE